MPSTSSSCLQQFGQPRLAEQVDAVVGRILGDDNQLAYAVGRELPRLGQHHLGRLRRVLAAHLGNRTEGAQPVAALGNFQVREVPRRDPQPIGIGQRANGGGPKNLLLFDDIAHQSVGHPSHFVATEHADQMIDARPLGEQVFLLPLGQTARNDDTLDLPAAFQLEHFIDRRV